MFGFWKHVVFQEGIMTSFFFLIKQNKGTMISWTWVRIRFYNFKQDKFCWMGVMVLVKGKWKESEVISKRSRLSIPATKVSSVSFSQCRVKFLDLHSMVRKKIYQGKFIFYSSYFYFYLFFKIDFVTIFTFSALTVFYANLQPSILPQLKANKSYIF